MNKHFFWMIVCLFGFGMKAYSQHQLDGVWLTENQKLKIQIYEKEGARYGKVVWVKDPEEDYAKEGMDILRDLKYSKGKWTGTMYIPRRDMTVKITLEEDGPGKAAVRVVYGGFGRNATWTRSHI